MSRVISMSEPMMAPKNRKRLNPGQRTILLVSRVIVWFFVLIAILPMWFVFTASLSPTNSYLSVSFFPAHASLLNYKLIFQHGQFLIWIRNSLIVSVTSSVLQVIITAFAAFAFSRLQFWGRKYGLMVLIILQMFPNFLAISAIYGILAQLNMMDSLGSYILVMLGSNAFNIWLLKGYFDSVPKELDEAALIDGATSWQRFTRILIPLAVPMLVVIFLFTLVGVFSEFAIAGTVLQSPSNYTLAVGMFGLISNQFGQNWGEFAAAALLSAIPLALIFGLAQRYIASGLVAGSVKG